MKTFLFILSSVYLIVSAVQSSAMTLCQKSVSREFGQISELKSNDFKNSKRFSVDVFKEEIESIRKVILNLGQEYRKGTEFDKFGNLVFAVDKTPEYSLIVDAMLKSIKVAAHNQITVMTLIENRVADKRPYLSRIKELTDFVESLPEKTENYVIKGQRTFYNSKKSSSGKLYVQGNEIEKRWLEIQTNIVKIEDVIRSLRELSPEILSSIDVQNGLKKMIMDGISISLMNYQIGIIDTTSSDREDNLFTYRWANESTDYNTFELRDFFTYILPAHFGIHVNFEKSNISRAIVQMNYFAFVQMTQELIRNSKEATGRRVVSEGRELTISNLPLVTLGSSNNRSKVMIEDFGDPSEYKREHNIGQGLGGVSRSSVGMGRYRIQLFADILGITITHQKKPDGSGSIFTLLLPK